MLIGIIAAISAMAADGVRAPVHGSSSPGLHNEDVETRRSASDVTLSGTLTMPEGAGLFPAAMLLSVGLPNDRDMTHPTGAKLLRSLAEHLALNGIASLRYDDRGIGGSTGSYFETTLSERAADALAGVGHLRTRERIDPAKVGVIGNAR